MSEHEFKPGDRVITEEGDLAIVRYVMQDCLCIEWLGDLSPYDDRLCVVYSASVRHAPVDPAEAWERIAAALFYAPTQGKSKAAGDVFLVAKEGDLKRALAMLEALR
jgi:hypothetical protein